MNDFYALRALMKHIADIGPTGCACSVTRHGETVFEDYCGYADSEKTKPIEPDTIYRIYSMTKVITCTAALMLFERGAYLLDDPLKEYMPEFSDMKVCSYDTAGTMTIKPAENPILIRDLFCMTSGLVPYVGDESHPVLRMAEFYKELRKERYGLLEAISHIVRVPLAFEPGTHWKYGMSHDVLGALIEVLSGKTFGAFLKDEIFNPLGMKDTFFHIPEDKKVRLSGLYSRNSDGTYTEYSGLKIREHFDWGEPYENGGGGLLSTLGDYMKFSRVLACGGEKDGIRLLGRKTLELMATNHLNPVQLQDYRNKPQKSGYGYGLGVRTMMDRAAGGCNGSIGEFGWGGAAGTWMMIDPMEEMAAVYMQQLWPTMGEYIQPRLRAVINAAL